MSPEPPYYEPPKNSKSVREANSQSENEPEVGKKRGNKKVVFVDWVKTCKADGVAPIAEDDAVWTAASESGLPDDFVRLQWLAFADRYGDDDKKYTLRGWPTVFARSVRENWFRVWFMRAESAPTLTTTGEMLQNRAKARAAARKAAA